MRRRDKAGGKATKTQRPRLKRRNAPKAPRRRSSIAVGKETNVAQLTRDLIEAREQQAATSEVLKVISNSPTELQSVLDMVGENAARLCDANNAVIFRLGGDILRQAAAYGGIPTTSHPTEGLPVNRGRVTGRAVVERRTIHIHDLAAEDIEFPEGSQDARRDGHRTTLASPLLREGTPIGAILIRRMEVRPFSNKQIALLESFAHQAVIAIENTRLLNELRQSTDDLSEALKQQTATSEVLGVISSSPGELQPVFDTMLAKATELCEASYGTMWLCEGDAFRAGATYGALPEAFIQLRRTGALRSAGPGSPAFDALTGKQPLHVADLRETKGYRDGSQLPVAAADIGGVRTMIAVPMFKDTEPVGVISIYRREVRPFTDKQIELVKNFAAQAVIAIENTRLLNELRKSLQQQTATADVLKVISRSTFDLQTVLNTLTESAARLCEADKGAIMMRDGDVYRIRANYGFLDEAVQYALNNPLQSDRGSATGRAALEGRAINIPDALADPEYRAAGYHKAFGYRSIIAIPLLREGTAIGTFTLTRDEVNPFTEKQKELATIFVDQAVIAIENVRLFDEVQARTRELSESLEQQTATSEVLKVISSSTGELQPVFQAMLENANKLCEAKFGVLLRYEEGTFRAAAMLNVPKAHADYLRQRGRFLPEPGIPLDRVWKTKELVHTIDEAASPNPAPAARLAGARSHICVPMLKDDDELVGALVIYRQEVRPFTDKQIELLKNFAAQAVIAIENTRLLNELRESLQQQTATANVLKVISRSTFDLRTVLQTLIKSAARLCDADKGNITREKDGVFYRAAKSYGYSPEFLEHVKGMPIEKDRGSATGRALLEKRVIHIPDVKADPEYTLVEGQRLGDYRTVLAVPMLREGIPLGVLTLTRSDVRPFTDKQIELVTTFADQAAIAIENVRLFESVEARTRELAASLENLRTTQDRLVQTQKLASLGQLTAGIAHEIKNPLNFVNNFSAVSVELIDELRQALSGAHLDGKLRAEISDIADTLQGNLDKVVQHGKRADAIVKNMLQHSREGSGEHRVVDINGLVEESLNLAWHGARAEKHGFDVTLERSFDPSAGEADIFPQDITRALLNLISNGFYAAIQREAETNGGEYVPTLAASTKSLGDRVEIRIRDNGTGIPPDVKEKMFNPFFTTKPTGEGTGLGLSISHDIIVKQHAGSIEVDTQPGEFTEIRVVLPRVAALLPERS